MLLFLLNWLLIFVFGIMTFRLKKLNESANNQRRLDNLNKFYELKDKAIEQESSGFVNRKEPKLSYHSSLKPENLNTPLLTGQSGVNYSDNEEMGVKMKNVVSMPVGASTRDLLESMDGVSTTSGMSDGMSANGSSRDNLRTNRGMSAVIPISSSNILQEMDALHER